MPAVFAKRAIADLRLMQKEKSQKNRMRNKETSSYTHQTENENDEDSNIQLQPGHSRVRIGNNNAPRNPLLLGDDESSNDSDLNRNQNDNDNDKIINITSESSDNDDHLQNIQNSNEDIRNWIVSDDENDDSLNNARGVGGDMIDHMLTRAAKPQNSAIRKYKKNRSSDTFKRKKYKKQLKQQRIPFLVEESNLNKKKDVISIVDDDHLLKFTKRKKNIRQPQLSQVAKKSKNVKRIRRPKLPNRQMKISDTYEVIDEDIVPSAQDVFPNVTSYHKSQSPDKQSSNISGNHPEGWAKIGKSSLDFYIKPLPTNSKFNPNTDIAKGYFHELINLSSTDKNQRSQPLPYVGLNCSLGAQMDDNEIMENLPTIFDEIFNKLSINNFKEINGLFKFLNSYVTLMVDNHHPNVDQFKIGVLDQIDHLLSRINNRSDEDDDINKFDEIMLIEIDWFSVEFLFRVNGGVGDDEVLETAFMKLVTQLLEIGIFNSRSVKPLRDKDNIKDLKERTLELWIAVIHLAPKIILDTSIWDYIIPCLNKMFNDINQHPVIESEIIWFTIFSISAISQLSLTGLLASSTPYVQACWALVHGAIDRVKIKVNIEIGSGTSSRALTHRDRYVRTLFARCFLLTINWNWKIDNEGSISIKLFDILNSRKLQDLLIEKTHDFPSFVRMYDDDLNKIIESSDSVFHILLKLIRRSVLDIRENEHISDREKVKLINRFISRVSPTRTVAISKLTQASNAELSILINHFSLVLMLLHVQPSSAKPRLAQAKGFSKFSEVDWGSRKVIVRAMMYMAIIHRHHSIDLSPVIDWFADMTQVLLNELGVVDKQLINNSANDNYTRNKLVRFKREIAVTVQMVLRSIQHVIVTPSLNKNFNAYPDIKLLHSCK